MTELAKQWRHFTEYTIGTGLGVTTMTPGALGGWHVIFGQHRVYGSTPEEAIDRALHWVDGYKQARADAEKQYAEAKKAAEADKVDSAKAHDAVFSETKPFDYYGLLVDAMRATAGVRRGNGLGGPDDHKILAEAIDKVVSCLLAGPKPAKRSKAEKTEIYSKIYSGR